MFAKFVASCRPSHRTRVMRAAVCKPIEELERRVLLSAAAGSLDSAFGSGGIASGYYVVGILPNSDMVAKQAGTTQLTLLDPAGNNLGPYTGAVPQPAYNVQSDGKYLQLSSGTLTRYNPDRSVDSSFGVNGKVTDFKSGTDATGGFDAYGVVVVNDQIFVVAGAAKADAQGGGQTYGFAIERLTSSGQIDHTFGDKGIAYGVLGTAGINIVSTFAVGPDSKIYVGGWDNYPLGNSASLAVERFTTAGTEDGLATTRGNFASVYGIAFQTDGKVLFLSQADYTNFDLFRLNADMTYDSSSFGQNGDVQVFVPATPDQYSSATAGELFLRPDGDIIVSGQFYAGYGTVAFVSNEPVSPPAGPTPYLGHPFNVATDTIEAENFDNGGEGVAYHDTTPQNILGGAYRNTAVDINVGGSSGYDVGYTAPGEWLTSSITNPSAEQVVLWASVASSKFGGKFHVEIDGQNVTGSMTVPDTGGWYSFQKLISRPFTVSAGNHAMRVVMDSGGYWGAIGNFDWFEMVPG